MNDDQQRTATTPRGYNEPAAPLCAAKIGEGRLRAALQYAIEAEHLFSCPARCDGSRDCTCGKEDAADLLQEMRVEVWRER